MLAALVQGFWGVSLSIVTPRWEAVSICGVTTLDVLEFYLQLPLLMNRPRVRDELVGILEVDTPYAK